MNERRSNLSSLAYFPSPFPDEDFRSILYRYHLSSFNPEMADTNKELFGSRSNFSVFPRATNVLFEQIASTSKFNLKTIVYENTLLPVFFPFIAHEHFEKILEEINIGGGPKESRIGKLVGNKYGKCISNLIKYCPCCMKDDDVNYGCSYIHREHQYAFISSCKKHHVQLISHCTECGIELAYSPLSTKCRNGHLIENYSLNETREDRVEVEVQNDLDYILNNSEKLNDSLIKQKFAAYLTVKGYMRGKTIRCQEFARDLLNYYSEEVITELGLDIDYLTKQNTYEHIFRGKSLIVNLPLMLLIIRFLGVTFEDFISETLPYYSEIPFGCGPWKCENKYCPKHEISEIKNCERIDNGIRGITGKFKCNYCNCTYIRL